MQTSNMASTVTSYYCTSYHNLRYKSRHLWSLTTWTTALHVSWRYHVDRRSKKIICNLWSYFFPTCEVLPFNSSAQAVGDRPHQRGGKGALAFRGSPRIMDCWAAAKLIVKSVRVCVHACVDLGDILHMQMHACLNLCVHVQYEKQYLHMNNTKLSDYNCMAISFRSTMNFEKRDTSSLSCLLSTFYFATHNY